MKKLTFENITPWTSRFYAFWLGSSGEKINTVPVAGQTRKVTDMSNILFHFHRVSHFHRVGRSDFFHNKRVSKNRRSMGLNYYPLDNHLNITYIKSMKNLLIILAVLIAMAIIWKIDEPRQRSINKYNCAVYGKMEDCKTPLPINQRLK